MSATSKTRHSLVALVLYDALIAERPASRFCDQQAVRLQAMRTHTVITFVGVMLVGTLTCAHAQWVNYPDARTPRTKDGKPNLTAPARRLNGKPDVSGLWQAERTPEREYDAVLGKGFTALQVDTYNITKNVLNVFWGMKPEDQPIRPEAAAIVKQRQASPLEARHLQCLPGSIPMGLLILTFKIIQTPQEIVILTETADPPRQIHMDGRPLPKSPDPTWMGYSVGHWGGDTLVVDTIGLNDRAWLDGAGHPRSESMHITERYHRRDFGHMDLEITFDDPKYYTRPFTLKTGLELIPDSDLLEYVCAENEKDRAHLGK
jgi:hypothetical protein